MADRHPKRSKRIAAEPEESSLGGIWRRYTSSGRYQPCFRRRNAQARPCCCVWRLVGSLTVPCYYSHRILSRLNRHSPFGSCLQVYKKDLCKRPTLGKDLFVLLWHRHRWNEDFGEGTWLAKSFLHKQAGTTRKTTKTDDQMNSEVLLQRHFDASDLWHRFKSDIPHAEHS